MCVYYYYIVTTKIFEDQAFAFQSVMQIYKYIYSICDTIVRYRALCTTMKYLCNCVLSTKFLFMLFTINYCTVIFIQKALLTYLTFRWTLFVKEWSKLCKVIYHKIFTAIHHLHIFFNFIYIFLIYIKTAFL